jgi:hypothetical protein
MVNLHFAFRQLQNAPVFALTAIFTLALGIGINAAMFSVVDQVLLRSMPTAKAVWTLKLLPILLRGF